MLQIKVNLLKNRLYITYSPYPEDTEGNGLHAIKKATEKLAPGFTCITRVTDLRNVDNKIVKFVRQARKLLEDKGVSGLARIGDFPGRGNDAARMIGTWKTARYDKYSFPVFTADTPEQAENVLDRWEKACNEETTPERKYAESIFS